MRFHTVLVAAILVVQAAFLIPGTATAQPVSFDKMLDVLNRALEKSGNGSAPITIQPQQPNRPADRDVPDVDDGDNVAEASSEGFEILRDYDLPGNDYRHTGTDSALKGLNAGRCEAACAADSACQAFTYNVKAKWCFLKDAAAAPVGFDGAISGRRSSFGAASDSSRSDVAGFNTSGDFADARELTGDEVRLLQRSLNALGYNAGKVDGVLGRGTRGSMDRYLADYGHPARTTDVEALRLVAEKAGFADQLSDTVILGYAAERARGGEVSVFTLDENTLTSIDFSDTSRRRGSAALNPAEYTDLPVYSDRQGVNESKLGLAAMMIAANPAILDDLEVVRSIFEIEGGTYPSSYRVAETLAAFREELERRTPPSMLKLALYADPSMSAGRYDRAAGVFPLNYGFDDKISRFQTLRLRLLGSNYGNYDIVFELPGLPDLGGIPMTLEEAEALEREQLRAFNQVATRVYVDVDGLTYDANRNTYTVHTNLRGADIRSARQGDDYVFFQWSAGDTTAAGAGGVRNAADLADFMGELHVFDGHIANDRSVGWHRIATALLLNAVPQALDDTATAIAVAESLLTKEELEALWQDVERNSNGNANEFDLADTAARVRGQFGETLQQRAVGTPFKLVDVRPVTLDRYEFESRSYGMNFNDDKDIKLAASGSMRLFANIGTTFLPERLELPEDLARQLDGVMRVKGDRRFYLGIFADVIGMSKPVSDASRYQTPYAASLGLHVSRIALYADPGLSKLVYDFYRDGDLKQLQDRKRSVFEAYEIEPQDRENLIAVVRDLTGDPEVVLRSIQGAEAYRRANELDQRDIEAELLSRFEQTVAPDAVWIDGWVTLGKFDVDTEAFAVEKLELAETRSVAQLRSEVSFELVNQVGGVHMSTDDARVLLDRFPGRRFQAKFRMTPVSATWASASYEYVVATIAAHLDEIYVLAGERPRMNDRDKAIIAHLTYEPFVPFVDAIPDADTPLPADPGLRQTLTQDLVVHLALAQASGDLSDRSLRWLMANRWLYDAGRTPGGLAAFFKPTDQPPTRAQFDALKPAFLAWLERNRPAAPQHVRLTIENVHTRLSVGSGAAIDASIEAAHCSHLKYGAFEDLLEGAEFGSLKALLSRQNDQIYRSDFSKPAILEPGLFIYPDESALECTSRAGGNLADDFVGDMDDWRPRVVVQLDRIPYPPAHSSVAYNMIEVDAAFDRVELRNNGSDVPHVVVHLVFEEARFASFDDGAATLVGNVTRADTVPVVPKAADGSDYDVVGVRLGMSEAEAEAIIAEHLGAHDILTSQVDATPKSPPLQNAKMYVRADHQERVALFFEESTGTRTVLAVERVVAAPNWGLPRQDVAAAANSKYGEPASADFGEYSTDMLWGVNVVDTGYASSKCQVALRDERIDDWIDANGNAHKIYEYFDWEAARNSGITDTPSLRYSLQDEFSVYQECGSYLHLRQDQFGLRTLLIDLKAYASAYIATREMLEDRFTSVEPGSGVDIKL